MSLEHGPSLDGKLRLHVNLTTPASEGEDDKARNGEDGRERDDCEELAGHRDRQFDDPPQVVGELSINYPRHETAESRDEGYSTYCIECPPCNGR